MRRTHDPAGDEGPTLRVPDELRTPSVVIRELTADDGPEVERVARSIGYVWGDQLLVPGSAAEAADLLSRWESLRASGRGNLVGLFTLDDRLLLVVAAMRDEFSAELSAWGTADARDRKLDADGVAALVGYLRNSAKMVRLWVDVPPHDRYTGYLVHSAGMQHEGIVTRPDGTTRERYSSM